MSFLSSIESNGFAIYPDLIDASTMDRLIESVESTDRSDATRSRGSAVFAVRNLLAENETVRAVARSRALLDVVESIIGSPAFAVRAIWFDKTPDANWKVPWHQDLSIAVRERKDVAGFGPWSNKSGLVHVQPPAEILQRMITVRIHLDDCHESNGPLKVIAGSHAHGAMKQAQIDAWRDGNESILCTVNRGGAVLMRPMILHASSPATSPAHRRVLHIEYSRDELPSGLEWHDRVGDRAS